MSEYDDSHMLSKILERMAAQSLHLKDKIDSGLEIPSWAEYKLYNAYSGLGKALGTAYPGTYGEEKMAAFSGALDRHPALKGKQSQLPDKIQAGIIKKKLRMRKQAASTESQVLKALKTEGGAAGIEALRKRVKSSDLRPAVSALIEAGKVSRHRDGDLIKESADTSSEAENSEVKKRIAKRSLLGAGVGATAGTVAAKPLASDALKRERVRLREIVKSPKTRFLERKRAGALLALTAGKERQAKVVGANLPRIRRYLVPAGAIGGALAANATLKDDAKGLVGKTKEAAAKTLGEGALVALGLPRLARKYNNLKSERLSKLLQTTVPGTEGIHLPGMTPERIKGMADMFSHPETAVQFAAPGSFLHMPLAEVAKKKMRGLADLGPKTALASATATKTDPAKWEAAKREAKSKMGGKHSARAMQLATQIYKKKGGGYSGAKPTSQNNSLKKWTKQKWQWSGGDKPGQGGKGVYLPKAKKDRLKDSEHGRRLLARASKKKSEATRKGEQYSSHGLAANTSLKAKK